MEQPGSPTSVEWDAHVPLSAHAPEVPPTPPTASGGIARRRGLLAGAGGALLLVLLVGGGGYALGHHAASSADKAAGAAAAAASASSADGRLSKAYNACSAQDSGDTLQLEDNGSTIVVDTRSKYGSVTGVACVFNRLNTPSSITAKVDSTTAMMGEQSATHDGISYSWSYHPDNGLNMVISLQG